MSATRRARLPYAFALPSAPAAPLAISCVTKNREISVQGLINLHTQQKNKLTKLKNLFCGGGSGASGAGGGGGDWCCTVALLLFSNVFAPFSLSFLWCSPLHELALRTATAPKVEGPQGRPTSQVWRIKKLLYILSFSDPDFLWQILISLS